MVPTPGNYATDPKVSCVDPLPAGNYPLPRCVSNLITAMTLKDTDSFDLKRLDKFKSKRKNSHILTYWAFFIRMDIIIAPSRGDIFPQGVYIPTDDQSYLSNYRNGLSASSFAYNVPFLSFNRSVADGNHTGLNTATSFLDASTIYGNSEADLQLLRDYGNRGKMKLATYPTPDGQLGYPRTDEDGNLIIGIKATTKNVFTDTFTTIFLREHNRLCDELYEVNKDSWDDEKYFQEARRWVIAYIQKITYYEYLGTALGVPLPPYTGYRPDIRPQIDTFFSSVTFRYGHSEISDFYNIVNEHGDYLATLSLHDLKEKSILQLYGVPSLALSLSLQLQEEVDIWFSENMRSYHAKLRSPDPAMDIAALDIIRARDHGIPSYNDARAAFGLSRKASWEEITSDAEVQQKLKSTYTSVDQIEPLMGALAEDHINGGNYGELISASFNATWTKIRDSDRFWYENKGESGFSSDDISKIQTTRLVDIIRRNTPKSSIFPNNLWFVQPAALSTSSSNSNYGYGVSLADGFDMQWKIEGSDVIFLITVSSINSWFGIGFNPNGAAMKDTDMMIFWNNEDSSGVVGMNYKGVDRAVKPRQLPPDDQIITLLSGTSVASGLTTVEVRRPLNAKNRKSLNNQIEMVFAWNLNSKTLSYHGGNRGTKMINLLTGESSGFADAKQKSLLLMHGIVMFIIWGVLFPGSVWIVRYLRHIDSYMTQHRNLNLLGGAIVAAFGAVAMSVVDLQASSPHGIMGIIIFAITGVQIALGILAIWALANVESAATGIVRYLKHFHFYLGGALLLAAWANIYLGMIQFDTKFNGNNKNRPYIWAYTGWLVMFGFIITASEFYYRIRNMQFLWPVKSTDEMSRRIRDCIPDKVYENLPSITWNEFNQRVMTGASLVIAEGLVFDIHRWIPIHPGGQKILKRVIGTDITNDFFFDPSVVTVINKNFEAEYDEKTNQNSISVLTDNMYREKISNKESANKPHSVANAVDMINATAFRDKRVAMHRHSKFATSKIATMVVARIIDPVEESGSIRSPSVSSPKQQKLNTMNINNDLNESQQPLPYPNIFRRYILSNIETVSRSDAERPVKKFTFQVIHPKDRLPKFLPGDYIEIMSEANNHVVIRPYTPLQGPSENSFCILVKIYKDGAMSQHLNKQLRNFEIKVRGPFDIADRMVQVSSPSLKPASIHSRPSSPPLPSPNTGNDNFSAIYSDKIKQRSQYGSIRGGQSLYSFGDSNIQGYNLNTYDHLLEGRSGILLNKEREDLCWDHLFMVCGGTGITPMLQLIQYHMDKATSGSKFNLYLLNANDTIADLIQPQYLDYLCTVLKGKLRITYILSKPPPIWKGLSGQIDDGLLFDWIHQNYSVPPPAIPPRLSNYGSAGGSNTNSMISTSTITNQNQPPPRPRNYGKGPTSEYDEFEEIIEPTRQQQQRRQYNDEELYDSQYRNRIPPPSPLQIPVETQTSPSDPHLSFNSQNLPYYFSPSLYNPQQTNEIIILNERYNYMRSLAADNTNQVKLVVCGTSRFNDSIKKCLEKLGFPIDEKALFIS
ncbi:heme peroxidase [Rhizophagus irregularis DAOM 181602=DAOM 197198]|nr:heme peroxidase [Rhizophagus irregularis DAOM 181602=DAOM 197198]